MTTHLNDDGTVRLDDNPHTRQLAITNCHLCDQDGYRGTRVCDHTDHTQTAQRHIAAIRAQMGWTNQPPQTTPENPGEPHSGAKNTPPTTNPHPQTTTNGHPNTKTPPAPTPEKL